MDHYSQCVQIIIKPGLSGNIFQISANIKHTIRNLANIHHDSVNLNYLILFTKLIFSLTDEE